MVGHLGKGGRTEVLTKKFVFAVFKLLYKFLILSRAHDFFRVHNIPRIKANIWNKVRFEKGMIQKWLRLLVKSLRSRIFSRSIWAQEWLVWTSRTSGNRVRVNDSFSSLFRYLSPLGDEIWKNFIWWLQSTFSPRLRFWHSNMATNNFRFLVYFESEPPIPNKSEQVNML